MRTTVRAIISQWKVNFPRSADLLKCFPENSNNQSKKSQKTQGKNVRDFRPTSIKLTIYDSTMQKTLDKNSIHGTVAR